MNYIKNIFNNKCEFFLVLLFIIFIVVGIEDNYKMAQIVELPQIKLVIIIISILLFIYCNRILGILGIFVAYEILNFSHMVLNEQVNIIPDEDKSWQLNFIPYIKSIEEEIIYKMMPTCGSYFGNCSYRPVTKNNNAFLF
jgi:hypothetical protein